MTIGFIGLGRMGKNMVLNLLDHKQQVVVYDRHQKPTKEMEKFGATPSYTLNELVDKLPKRKIVWIMITSSAVDEILKKIVPLLKKEDIIIDGGNSYFKDSIRRYNELRKKGIHFVDVGTSGGMEGARNGACLMIGGEKEIYKTLEPTFKALATKNGYGYMGKIGAGHFVKMVHNGIEYGMMAAIGEGFETLENYRNKFGFNLKEITKVYSHGSIISSSLINWLNDAINKKEFGDIKGEVPTGETEKEMESLTKLSEMPILKLSIQERIDSRKRNNYRSKVVAALRNEFGGHKVEKK